MANQHLFYAGKMGSQQVDVLLAGAVVLDGNDDPIEVENGSLVDLGNLRADDTYDANGKQLDVYDAKAPTATPTDLAIVDYAGIPEGEINGNQWKLGVKLYSNPVPAGTITRVRRFMLHDKFWLGAANYETAPAMGDHYGIKANAFVHAKIADMSQHTGYAVKIQLVRELTTGMRSQGKQYLNEVVAL